MDLRPKIAREIAMDIIADLRAYGNPTSDAWVECWVPLILGRIVAHSIEFPNGEEITSTEDSGTVQQFLDKYPTLKRLVELTQTEALQRWPAATFKIRLLSDPESCHICYEGQHLELKILTGEEPPQDLQERWVDLLCDEGPCQDLAKEIGEVATLLQIDLEWEELWIKPPTNAP